MREGALVELAVDALGGFGGATRSGSFVDRGQAELGDQGVLVASEVLTKHVESHEFDGCIGRRGQIATGSRRVQACFIVDGDAGADTFPQQQSKPLPHQGTLGILEAVPANHFVGKTLAAPAHQIAVSRGANPDAGRATQRDGRRFLWDNAMPALYGR